MTPNSASVWLNVPEIGPPMPGGFGANGLDLVGDSLIIANGDLVAVDPTSNNPASTVRVISLTLDGAPPRCAVRMACRPCPARPRSWWSWRTAAAIHRAVMATASCASRSTSTETKTNEPAPRNPPRGARHGSASSRPCGAQRTSRGEQQLRYGALTGERASSRSDRPARHSLAQLDGRPIAVQDATRRAHHAALQPLGLAHEAGERGRHGGALRAVARHQERGMRQRGRKRAASAG